MKKNRSSPILYLALQILFIVCALLFLTVLLVCEPYDRIPVGIWFAVCVWMAVQMGRRRRHPPSPPPDKTP